jgi:hypothetical protein
MKLKILGGIKIENSNYYENFHISFLSLMNIFLFNSASFPKNIQ